MGAYNNLNPNTWHNRTLNQIHNVADSKESGISRNSKLVRLNLLAIGTAAAAAFAQLAKLILIQPLGMAAKGGIGVIRLGWPHFADQTYEKLPGLSDWAFTGKKLAVLIIDIPLSFVAAVGSIVTPKASSLNVKLNTWGGTYIKAVEKKPEDKEYLEAVEQAKKLPTLAVLQSQADVTKKEAIRLEAALKSANQKALDAVDSSKTAAVANLQPILESAEQAKSTLEKDGQTVRSHLDNLKKYVDNAKVLQKARLTDQACVDAFSGMLKEVETLHGKAKQTAGVGISSAEEAITRCKKRQNDFTSAQQDEKAAEAAKSQADRVKLLGKQAVTRTADELQTAAKDKKDLAGNVSRASTEADLLDKEVESLKKQVDLFPGWIKSIEEKEKEDAGVYGKMATAIRDFSAAANKAYTEILKDQLSARAAADKVAKIQRAHDAKTDTVTLAKSATAITQEIGAHLGLAEQKLKETAAQKTAAIQKAGAGQTIENNYQVVCDLIKEAEAELAQAEIKGAQLKKVGVQISDNEAAGLATQQQVDNQNLLEKNVEVDISAIQDSVKAGQELMTLLEQLKTDLEEASKLPDIKTIREDAAKELAALKLIFKSIPGLKYTATQAARDAQKAATASDVETLKQTALKASEEAKTQLLQTQAHIAKLQKAVEQLKVKEKAYQAKPKEASDLEDKFVSEAAALENEVKEAEEAVVTIQNLLVEKNKSDLCEKVTKLNEEITKGSEQAKGHVEEAVRQFILPKDNDFDASKKMFENVDAEIKKAKAEAEKAKSSFALFELICLEGSLDILSDRDQQAIRKDLGLAKTTVEESFQTIAAFFEDNNEGIEEGLISPLKKQNDQLRKESQGLDEKLEEAEEAAAIVLKATSLEEAKKAFAVIQQANRNRKALTDITDLLSVYKKQEQFVAFSGQQQYIKSSSAQSFSAEMQIFETLTLQLQPTLEKLEEIFEASGQALEEFEEAVEEAKKITSTNDELKEEGALLAQEAEECEAEIRVIKSNLEKLSENLKTDSLKVIKGTVDAILDQMSRAEELLRQNLVDLSQLLVVAEIKKQARQEVIELLNALNANKATFDQSMADILALDVDASCQSIIPQIGPAIMSTFDKVEKSIPKLNEIAKQLLKKANDDAEKFEKAGSKENAEKIVAELKPFSERFNGLLTKVVANSDSNTWTDGWLNDLGTEGYLMPKDVAHMKKTLPSVKTGIRELEELYAKATAIMSEMEEAAKTFDPANPPSISSKIPSGGYFSGLFGKANPTS